MLSPGRPCGCGGSPGPRRSPRGSVPCPSLQGCGARAGVPYSSPLHTRGCGVSCAARSSSLPRRLGVAWLSSDVGTTEEAWETQKFGLLFFPPPFLKKPFNKLIPSRTVCFTFET